MPQPHTTASFSARRAPIRQFGYLLVAVAAIAANLALWAAGYQYTIVTGMLVGTACAGVVCWRQVVSEERLMARVDAMAADMWWHGYATALEDQHPTGSTSRVVPFRRGDRSGDTSRAMNASELI